MNDLNYLNDEDIETVESLSEEVIYLQKMVANFKPLTAKEERALFEKRDYDTIVLHHARYIYGYVKKMLGEHCIYFADAFQDGVIKLKEAAKTYDLNVGVRFISYAQDAMKGSIMATRCKHTTKLKSTQFKDNGTVLKMQEKFYNQNGYDPTCADLANFMWGQGVTLERKDEDSLFEYITELLSLSRETTSMDSSVGTGDDNDSLVVSDMLTDHTQADDALCADDSFQHDLAIINQVLKPRESDIFISANGIGLLYPTSIDDLADKYNISNVQVYNILKNSSKKLENYFKK